VHVVDHLVHVVDSNRLAGLDGRKWGRPCTLPARYPFREGAMKKKPQFVKLERRLFEHRAYRMAGPLARDLYSCMLNSIFNENNGGVNHTARKVAFGPADAKLLDIPKSTYHKYVGVLIRHGIIEELTVGGHGRKAEYDLESWKYKLDF